MPPVSIRIRPVLHWCDANILIPITLCCLLGIVTAKLNPALLSPAAGAGISAALAIAALLLFARKSPAALLLCLPLFFLTGYLTARYQYARPLDRHHIASLLTDQRRVTLVGSLVSMVEQGPKKSRFDIQVKEVLVHGDQAGWQPVHGRVRLSIRTAIDSLQPGMPLMILTTAARISNIHTPGSFDYAGYMAAGNIYVSGWINSPGDIIPIQDQTIPRLQRLAAWPELTRQRVAVFLRRRLPSDVAGLYQALLVGSRTSVAPQILEQFKATGTMHMLAISGIHMGLLGLMIGAVLNRLLRRSQWLLLHCHVPSLALAGTLPVLLGYAFIAGMNTPVLRALIMATILLSAVLLRRQHSLLHLVSGAALLILLWNPLVLFTASFQLSFAAVTALALFFPELNRSAPAEEQTAWWTKLLTWAKTALLVSLTATLATLPFMLYFFHRFSLIGPVMNLFVEPLLCFWALPWGLAAIPFIFFSPDIAVLLLQIGGFGIQAGQFLVQVGSRIPFASLWTITPNFLEISIYAALLILWSIKDTSLQVRRVLAGAALLLIAHFTWGLWVPSRPAQSTISYLDVGQGSASFLHLPNGTRLLIDGGGSRGSALNAGERIIAPFLWKKRIWRLDLAVISHPHSDHFNGMAFILKHFRPKTLYINGDRQGEGGYDVLLAQAVAQGITVVTPRAGDILVQGKNFSAEVLGMNGLPVKDNAPVNDRCLVVKYSTGRRAFLFPADISTRSENLLQQEDVFVKADVLLAPHHGSATSNSSDFIAAVNPSIIIVSAGKSGKAHYPAPANLAAWQKQNITTCITRDQGTIICRTDGSTLKCSGSVPRNRAPALLPAAVGGQDNTEKKNNNRQVFMADDKVD